MIGFRGRYLKMAFKILKNGNKSTFQRTPVIQFLNLRRKNVVKTENRETFNESDYEEDFKRQTADQKGKSRMGLKYIAFA